MKGVLLAGGTGTRLAPLTSVVNKHLLPVYNKPMILYPLDTLKRAGVTDIMLVTGPEHIGRFIEFLGDGAKYGVNLTYRIQEKAGGIAEALGLCGAFAEGEDVHMILGDNIFSQTFIAKKSKYGCTVFLKPVDVTSARSFGCAMTKDDKVIYVEEKPKDPKSTLAVSGYYIFSLKAFEFIKSLKPSARGELEITDLIDFYVKNDDCGFSMIDGYWSDAGTFDSLLKASTYIRDESKTS
ncbi:MAG: sugar phosphate nucleotidyltransferase [Candidatus Taylorbacteria bacterium]|nr:sugar phosphate nucleotidyltransferase [Candidatus Taylorbacteria bacterium]